jgi:endonuclease YncB( thermonuclease family)
LDFAGVSLALSQRDSPNSLKENSRMQILPFLLAAAVAAIQTSHEPTRSDPVLVTAVRGGDTVVVSGIGSVHLLGIDAPKMGRDRRSPAPFAREAEDRLSSLVLHRWIRLEQDGPHRAGAARGACVWTEDGQFVNAAIVRDGLASLTAHLPSWRTSELQQAQADAQAAHRGIWGGTPRAGTEEYRLKTPRPPKVKPSAKSPKAKKRAGGGR